MTTQEKKLVRADIAQVMLLDKILDSIRIIEAETKNNTEQTRLTQEMLKSTIAEGIIEPLTDLVVTTEQVVVTPPHKDLGKLWFGVKLTNDGPDSAFFIINPEKSTTTPQELKLDETWGVDFKTAVIAEILFYTKTGTATVRVRGIR